LIICQSCIPDKALTMASSNMTAAIILGLLVHVKISNMFEWCLFCNNLSWSGIEF